MKWQLRNAERRDADAIAELWHGGWHDGHAGHVPVALLAHRGLLSFRERVPERLGGTTVALHDSRVIGFVTVVGDELEQLFVAAGARGSGVAAALLRHAEHTIARNFELAWLAAATGNARARRFYSREGWHDVGAFDYEAQVAGGSVLVPCHRYEKRRTLSASRPGE